MTRAEFSKEMPRAYDPKAVESRIYQNWMDGGFFTPTIDKSRSPFVIIMPPPNVTGELHMGHALTVALEDLMVRWHRMKGDPTLFIPGTDHAGIATQVVVERMLANEGITRHDLGREQFVDRVWKWVDMYGDRIYEQFKRLGASCDWNRSSFTLDEGPSIAVRTTFVNLYRKGLIYRGERITNWCPRCVTALSDLEVKYQEEDGHLYYIRYLREDGERGVTVATTRPETLFGDTGVAVNPEDDRYIGIVGENVILPLVGKKIPVVPDETVDPKFGTGALKVTPGHDAADFEIGQRHGLPIITVMELDGRMNGNAGIFKGQERFECRNNVVKKLEQEGLIESIQPNPHSIGHCDRCEEIVEPIVSSQWYVKTVSLAEPARQAVSDGRIQIVPQRFAKVYFNWMDNIREWCISRQLWWGHRIPVWYCLDCEETIVEFDDPTTCIKCDSENLEQDPDMLDTWFSSGLWTHSTLGWPDQTEDLAYFYPASVMETGHDILFFWVARMIMLGIENMGEPPFHTVYLHGLIRDPSGVKMSKSKGNVLNPLDLIDMYGSDALRFALTTGNSPGNDMRLSEQKLEGSRNFANKLWNASRFVISNLKDGKQICNWDEPNLDHRHDSWIVSRFNQTVDRVNRYMEEYQFGEAQRIIYDFLWNEYCDWYIEMSKVRMRSETAETTSPLPVLAFVLDGILRALHPFMPFITEEIWGVLMGVLPSNSSRAEALIVAEYPEAMSEMVDEIGEYEIDSVISVIRAVRNLRAEFRLPANELVPIIVDIPELGQIIQNETEIIAALAQAEILESNSSNQRNLDDQVSVVVKNGTVSISLKGLVDLDRERQRLNDEIKELEENCGRLSVRLNDRAFLSKAPENVVERERQRLETAKERKLKVNEILSRLST